MRPHDAAGIYISLSHAQNSEPLVSLMEALWPPLVRLLGRCPQGTELLLTGSEACRVRPGHLRERSYQKALLSRIDDVSLIFTSCVVVVGSPPELRLHAGQRLEEEGAVTEPLKGR